MPLRDYSPAERRWRLGLTAVLAVYGWVLLRSPGSYTWLDSLDLAIHETGHLVFAFGGEFLTLLGGTLLQLLVPAAFALALWRQGDRHGATIPVWWLGQSCWNVSVYIKDARAQELPLVGGGEHDWAILLGELGWLPQDQAIGGAVYLLGALVYGAAIVAGWMVLSRDADAPAKHPAARVRGSAGLLLLLVAGTVEGQEPRFLNPPALPPARGYTQVVEVPAGNRLIFLSGQVPLDSTGAPRGGSDFRAQARQVFENIRAGLAAAGADFGDVVKLNFYILDSRHLPALREVRDQYVNRAAPPASTLVQVSRLFRKDVLLEVEAVAAVRDEPQGAGATGR